VKIVVGQKSKHTTGTGFAPGFTTSGAHWYSFIALKKLIPTKIEPKR